MAHARSAFDPASFTDCTVLVTGASSGLGRASAIALSRHGARVILMGRDQARLEGTVAEMDGPGHSVIAAAFVSADETTDLVKAAATATGPIDGIFHAAGLFAVTPIKMTKQRNIDDIFAASVSGAYGIMRASAMRNVMNDGGSIILMSSVAGERGHGGLAAYAGAKAAIMGLVRAAAVELAPRHIRVNGIVAGTIDSEMHQKSSANAPAGSDDAHRAQHPLGFGTPADVADGVLFLLSDASRWITGTALTIDGGYLA